ncbi:hypothetical protein G9F71_002715 [Clostridium sp. FP2]|uniref:hypothetical protein n=1 Tax=Clostridium sp. FP2 TaxID=2724481 RepID=UPI0013E93EA4|nr:hypothetical protein [Clostridium sp. FP2]MBZ9621778.1 hypothetical protein [Clostridium sp. FP2]
MNKRLIILLVCFILFLILIPTLFYKPLVGINTYIKTDIKKIDSITNSVAGQPLVLVVGVTKNGLRKGAWFDRRSFINFDLVVESNLENSISKEEALAIIKENQLLHTVSYMQLQYFNIHSATFKITEGPYWFAVDTAFGCGNGDARYVYIDQ